MKVPPKFQTLVHHLPKNSVQQAKKYLARTEQSILELPEKKPARTSGMNRTTV